MTDKIIFYIIIAVCVLLMIGVLVIAKRREKNYDERQLLARNAAFKTAFFTLAFYCFVCGLLNLCDISWANIEIQMFMGIMLSTTVFAVICIVKDAYFDFTDKRKWQYIITSFGLATVNLIGLLVKIGKGQIDRDIFSFAPLIMCSVCLYSVGATAAAKAFFERKREDN